jgi:hypothetical protein
MIVVIGCAAGSIAFSVKVLCHLLAFLIFLLLRVFSFILCVWNLSSVLSVDLISYLWTWFYCSLCVLE